jgi:hypothetical protein
MDITPDRRIQAMIIAWCFGSLSSAAEGSLYSVVSEPHNPTGEKGKPDYPDSSPKKVLSLWNIFM